MVIKASEAKEKQCPFIVMRHIPDILTARNMANDTTTKKLLSCGGTDCMAWRKQPDETGYCGLVPIVPSELVAF